MLSSVSPSNQVFSVIAESPSDAEILLAFKKSATTQSEGAIASVRCRIEDRNGIRVGVIDQLLDLASPEAPFDQARIGVFFDLVEESVC